MKDFVLEISFDARDGEAEGIVHVHLFGSASTGSTSWDANGTTTVAAYFASAEDRDAVASQLEGVAEVELHAVERERVDWLELYQQSLEPIRIGRRFVIAPDARLLPDDPSALTIVVPQEQAFGTGSHETTSLCIELLEGMPIEGTAGLDVGAGSGILAIAMHRLGARRAIAFDNDTDAYGALRDNRIRNGIPAETMPLFIGSVEALRGGSFDVITMNIIPEVILPLLGDVVARLAAKGTLILSGILLVRRDDVVAAAATHGLALVEERARGEWWAGALRKSE
ncbi:MAG: 50S ribosomal protein L11 methyltransferase [Thermoanaerobaculia bacterium]